MTTTQNTGTGPDRTVEVSVADLDLPAALKLIQDQQAAANTLLAQLQAVLTPQSGGTTPVSLDLTETNALLRSVGTATAALLGAESALPAAQLQSLLAALQQVGTSVGAAASGTAVTGTVSLTQATVDALKAVQAVQLTFPTSYPDPLTKAAVEALGTKLDALQAKLNTTLTVTGTLALDPASVNANAAAVASALDNLHTVVTALPAGFDAATVAAINRVYDSLAGGVTLAHPIELSGATIAAIQNTTATIANFPTNFPDAASAALAADIKAQLVSVNAALQGTITTRIEGASFGTSGGLIVDFPAGKTLGVTGPLTDTQLRAAPVSVTDAGLSALAKDSSIQTLITAVGGSSGKVSAGVIGAPATLTLTRDAEQTYETYYSEWYDPAGDWAVLLLPKALNGTSVYASVESEDTATEGSIGPEGNLKLPILEVVDDQLWIPSALAEVDLSQLMPWVGAAVLSVQRLTSRRVRVRLVNVGTDPVDVTQMISAFSTATDKPLWVPDLGVTSNVQAQYGRGNFFDGVTSWGASFPAYVAVINDSGGAGIFSSMGNRNPLVCYTAAGARRISMDGTFTATDVWFYCPIAGTDFDVYFTTPAWLTLTASSLPITGM